MLRRSSQVSSSSSTTSTVVFVSIVFILAFHWDDSASVAFILTNADDSSDCPQTYLHSILTPSDVRQTPRVPRYSETPIQERRRIQRRLLESMRSLKITNSKCGCVSPLYSVWVRRVAQPPSFIGRSISRIEGQNYMNFFSPPLARYKT